MAKEKTEPKFYVAHNGRIPSDKRMDEIFYDYSELPTHVISKLMGRSPEDARTRNRLAQRWRLGDLLRFQSLTGTAEDPRKTSKHNTYSINTQGLRDTRQRGHRVLQSMVKASTEIGATEHPDFEYISFRELVTARNAEGMPVLPAKILDLIDKGMNPHHIPVGDTHFDPDGAPNRLYHIPTNGHLNIIDEIDRNTEPLATTKERRNIQDKLKTIHEWYEKNYEGVPGWQEHYGFVSRPFIRWVTIDQSRTDAIRRLQEKLYGPTAYMLFTTWEDWTSTEVRSYPLADGDMFTRAYDRAGMPPFYLNRFFEMK